jgi:hypothetical protein
LPPSTEGDRLTRVNDSLFPLKAHGDKIRRPPRATVPDRRDRGGESEEASRLPDELVAAGPDNGVRQRRGLA